MTDSGWQLDINQLTIFNMIVHTMNSKELLKEIFNDYKIVERKANYLGLSLRREAVKSKEKHVHRIFDYSVSGNYKCEISVNRNASVSASLITDFQRKKLKNIIFKDSFSIFQAVRFAG